MTTAADLHTLTGAYATHALGEAERHAFEQHLSQCPACEQEVREFTSTLARLGAAEAVVPPHEMKARVLAGIGTVRQLAPVSSEPDQDGAGRRPGRLARQWPKLALAASVAVAATLGGLAYQQHDRAEQAMAEAAALQQQQARFSSLLTAPDARTSTGTAGGGVGTVVWSETLGQAGFLASGLPTLPPDKAYEIWFNDAGTMRPAGLLPGPDGSLLLAGGIQGAAGIGVTVEPAGGSAHPTGSPMMLLDFT
ncbi:anti-sigma factor domain-containing protein [Kitasatospora sp. NPDC088346]|uniref:anti-sigma factor n=1 Tax=Kitasatospora sp. NPDC088346 TaxID=3364073 RepID=UPI0037F7DD36